MVRDDEEEGNKIQGKWSTAEERRCHHFLNCSGTYSVSSKAAKLQKKLTDLKREAEAFDAVVTMQSPGRGQSIPTQSALLGLQPYVAKVRSYISSDEAGVIGVWCMGGVGKTTLLKEIYNSLLGKGNLGFDYLIWSVVSKECKLENLQTQIAKSLGLNLREDGDASSHATVIYNFLKDKSFLLFLDDIWKAYRFDDIGIPEPQNKQKMELTTHLEHVCGEMGAHEFIIKVEYLKPDDSWSVFKKKVGERILRCHPRIERLAREVADECGGLPLALTIIGQAMSTRRSPEEWEHALMALRKSHVDDILREDEGMFHKLKFSYDSLHDDATRECFLCCSLWPEDSYIDTDDLILCWMGLGFIKNFESMEEAFNKGHSLIGDIKGACMLESGCGEVIECVKMHDVIRDLALWIASDCGRSPNKWVVKAGVGLSGAPREVKIWREAERISLMGNGIREVGFPNHYLECSKLSSLMLQSNINWLYYKIHPGFFLTMHALTYLDLSRSYLKVLPPDVGMLKMLQYLNLSYTYISSLPKELGSLLKLRYLHLDSTHKLCEIPPGVISSLSELQVFDLYKSAYGANDDDVVGSLIDELERVEGGIQALGITLKSAHLLGRLSKSPRLSMWRLLVQRLCDQTSFQLEYNVWPCLKWLQLDSCKQVDVLELIGGVGKEKDITTPIEFLHLRALSKLEEIRWRGVVPHVFFGRLRNLKITSFCNMLKSVTWTVGLPSLVELLIMQCNGIEQVADEEEIKEQGYYDGTEQVKLTFPSLKKLVLSDLPKLRCICSPGCAFPVLEYVSARGCPELKKLPFHSQNTTTLREIRCSKDWWEGLKREEEGIKDSFLAPYVTHPPTL